MTPSTFHDFLWSLLIVVPAFIVILVATEFRFPDDLIEVPVYQEWQFPEPAKIEPQPDYGWVGEFFTRARDPFK